MRGSTASMPCSASTRPVSYTHLGAAGQVDPEVAQLSCGAAADAARQGHQHAEADRRADEVLHREADHLAEVAQRGLAAVGLPVGVGDETDRGVERQCPFQARQVLRVQRQAALQLSLIHILRLIRRNLRICGSSSISRMLFCNWVMALGTAGEHGDRPAAASRKRQE